MNLQRTSFHKIIGAFLLLTQGVKVTLGQGHTSLTLGQKTGEVTTSCNQSTYFKVEATEPCMDLKIDVTQIAGEPNLYVSRGLNMYPSLRNLAWSSYNWGSDTIIVSSNDPDYQMGTFYIGVHAYCGSDVHTGNTDSKYTVEATHQAHFNQDTGENIFGKTIGGTLDANDYTWYRFCAPKRCQQVNATLKHCMTSSEPNCQGKYGFPELLVSRTVKNPTVTDKTWLLAESNRRTIELLPSDPDFDPGHYYVGVYGWCTPDGQCPDRTTCGPCDLTQGLSYTVQITGVDIPDEECQKMLSQRPNANPCGVGGAVSLLPNLVTMVMAICAYLF